MLNLEKYYKNPVLKPWTYVNIGMERLKEVDGEYYDKLRKEQDLLSSVIDEKINGMKKFANFFSMSPLEMENYIKQFICKFPLILNEWEEKRFYDHWFVFFYILIKKYKPKLIIETGSNIGFSSTFIALGIKENNNNSKFYTMDVSSDFFWQKTQLIQFNKNLDFANQGISALFMVPSDLKENITYLSGDSRRILPELLKEDSQIDIFFHDSEHSYHHMLWECNTILPHLKEGGFLFIHDVGLNLAALNDIGGNLETILLGDNLGVIRKSKAYKMNRKIKTFFDFRCSNKANSNFLPQMITIQTREDYYLDPAFAISNSLLQEGNLDYKSFYEGLLGEYPFLFSGVKKIVFGENRYPLSQIKEIKKLIIGFLESFPEADVVFYTEGINLNQELMETLSYPFGKYHYRTKNIINLFLSASNDRIYFGLTNTDYFNKIVDNLKYLLKIRREPRDTLIFLNFTITTGSIDDLPNFIRFSSQFNISGINCVFNETENSDGETLLEQKTTRITLEESQKIAKDLGIPINLPVEFRQNSYPGKDITNCHFPHLIFTPDKIFYTCGRVPNCNNKIVFNNDKIKIDLESLPQYKRLKDEFDNNIEKCFKHCLYCDIDNTQLNSAC